MSFQSLDVLRTTTGEERRVGIGNVYIDESSRGPSLPPSQSSRILSVEVCPVEIAQTDSDGFPPQYQYMD